MNLFRKKCEYCKQGIDKGKEIFKDVKILGFTGTSRKAFCCSNHADSYERELEEYAKKPKQSCGCCG